MTDTTPTQPTPIVVAPPTPFWRVVLGPLIAAVLAALVIKFVDTAPARAQGEEQGALKTQVKAQGEDIAEIKADVRDIHRYLLGGPRP